MKLPIPPFAYPVLILFGVAVWYGIFPPKFPIWGLDAHAYYGLLFLAAVVLCILVAVALWLYQRKRKQLNP